MSGEERKGEPARDSGARPRRLCEQCGEEIPGWLESYQCPGRGRSHFSPSPQALYDSEASQWAAARIIAAAIIIGAIFIVGMLISGGVL